MSFSVPSINIYVSFLSPNDTGELTNSWYFNTLHSIRGMYLLQICYCPWAVQHNSSRRCFMPMCLMPFRFIAPCQFTPLLNYVLAFLILHSMAHLFPFISFLLMGISFLIYTFWLMSILSRTQLGCKTMPWCSGVISICRTGRDVKTRSWWIKKDNYGQRII